MGYIAVVDGERLPVAVSRDEAGQTMVTVGEKEYLVDASWTQSEYISLLINGKSYQIDIHADKDKHQVLVLGEHFDFEFFDERKALLKRSAGLGVEGVQEIKSSMPGKIVKVLVAEGQEVAQGDGLVVVEAMKMENEIKSPKAGVVKKIGVGEGQTVESGTLLVIVE